MADRTRSPRPHRDRRGAWRAPSRRTLLRGLLGGSAVAIGLPVLEAFLDDTGRAFADGSAFPRRFALFFWGNGNIPARWVPTSEGPGYALSEQLAPLEAHKADFTVVTGLDQKIPNRIPHGSGAAGILSGARPGGTDGDMTFLRPSIDQVIAQQVGGATRFRSLEFGADPGGGLSYNGPHSRNPPERSPFLLFERVFGAGFREPGEEGLVDPTLALRRSVLDAVLEDARALRGRVGVADKARLDQHLEGIRELELRLARLEEDPPQLAACRRPTEPPEVIEEIDGRPQLWIVNRLLCDLATMAMACDQTRVVSNYFTHPVSNVLFPGATDGHHNLTHDEGGDQPQVHAIVLQCMEELAWFIGSLASHEEGEGRLLDNTALLATTEVSLGRTHSLEDMPVIVAGSCCGALRTGTHIRSSGENSSRLLLTLVRAMGISAPTFGADEGLVSEGLTALES